MARSFQLYVLFFKQMESFIQHTTLFSHGISLKLRSFYLNPHLGWFWYLKQTSSLGGTDGVSWIKVLLQLFVFT